MTVLQEMLTKMTADHQELYRGYHDRAERYTCPMTPGRCECTPTSSVPHLLDDGLVASGVRGYRSHAFHLKGTLMMSFFYNTKIMTSCLVEIPVSALEKHEKEIGVVAD